MGFFNRLSDMFGGHGDLDDEDYLDDDYVDDEFDDVDYTPSRNSAPPKKKSGGVSFFRPKLVEGGNVEMEVTMVKPSSIGDASEICHNLLDGKAVVINMEGISSDTAQRILDFTSGSVYSIDGDLQMISRYIFIASPSNIDLTGSFQAAATLAGVQDRGRGGAQQSSGFNFNV